MTGYCYYETAKVNGSFLFFLANSQVLALLSDLCYVFGNMVREFI